MPSPERAKLWSVLLDGLSRSAGLVLVAATMCRTLERAGVGLIAASLFESPPRRALYWAAALAGLASCRALLTRWARRRTRAWWLTEVASALVRGAAVGRADGREGLVETLLRGTEAGEVAVCESLPDALGSGFGLLALGAIAIATRPSGPMVAGLVTTFAVCAAMLASVRLLRPSEQQAREALARFSGRIVTIASAHVELAASARRGVVLDEVGRRADAWVRAAARGDRLATWLTRVPAMATFGVVVSFAVVGASEFRLEVSFLSAMAVAGFAAGRAAADLLRGATAMEAVSDLLRRPGLPSGAGGPLPPLPARISAHELVVDLGEPNDVTRALNHVSFTWKPGEILVIAGRNGSGKSTLLRTLAGMHPPTSGELLLGEKPLHDYDLDELRRRVTYVPQEPFVPAQVDLRGACAALGKNVSDDLLLHWLDVLGLREDLEDKHPGDPLSVRVGALSTGQRQRLSLASSLSESRPIVLLDEPDAFLDSSSVERLAAALVAEREGKLIAVAAHSRALAAIGDVELDLDPRSAVSAEPSGQGSTID
jgi:ABC-type multidrug transport system fused ATPase/permease subunit